MPIEVKKREGEVPSSLIYRFTKKIQRSGVLREAKGKRFRRRPVSSAKRRLSALHRARKRKEFERAKKQGLL